MQNIRNFSIIAHIDHGKSTLADRMLELTETVEKRKMKEQVLDSMELERERGITIKMQPVRMRFTDFSGDSYMFNLIDTPGHIDFSYEVSRALKAVEGCILLVDATQGVQAQTFSVLDMAREQGLVIIPVLSKIDSPLARIEEVKKEVVELIDCALEDIILSSGKTGEGVKEIFDAIIKRVPQPAIGGSALKALVFDFHYSNHRGVTVYTRVFEGSVSSADALSFAQSGETFTALEVGEFAPEERSVSALVAGEIGYITTGIKKAGVASVGDTIIERGNAVSPLEGYREPRPVVWASVYPESQDDFEALKQALLRLRLSDSSLSFEEESSSSLGRGFRCGFLGMLHLEIVSERLKREFNLHLVITMPSITYSVIKHSGEAESVYSPSKFPDHGSIERIEEPWIKLQIIIPQDRVSALVPLLYEHEGITISSETFGKNRVLLVVEMPLRELMRNFFDRLKNATSGYASFSYEALDIRPADVVRLDVLVAENAVPALSRVVARRRLEEEAKDVTKRLHAILPRQLFVTKIQASALGRIISSKTLPALKKNVTAHLYGGDITRKMKLREKQKKGKKKMEARGKVSIPHDVFLKMVKSE